MPSVFTIHGGDIEMKYSQVIQSSLTLLSWEFLVECILKENTRSCVTLPGYLFCCNDVNKALQTLLTFCLPMKISNFVSQDHLILIPL